MDCVVRHILGIHNDPVLSSTFLDSAVDSRRIGLNRGVTVLEAVPGMWRRLLCTARAQYGVATGCWLLTAHPSPGRSQSELCEVG
jgi:hypothetical protein